MLVTHAWNTLRRRGVLGINARNADMVLAHNPRRLYPLVDDKLTTKRLLLDAGIRAPALIGTIATEHDIANLADTVNGHDGFVIKPAQGAGGDGVLVVQDRFEGRYRTTSGRLLSDDDVGFHLSGILSGIYSLGGHHDQALIEYRVQPDPVFSAISFEGVPDLRIIIYRGYPVMAMLRLPSRQSQGKANLHQGAIGVGVDMAEGITVGGTWHNMRIFRHPDTANPVAGVQIPRWGEFLYLATRCYELTGLGYLGVDLVLDRQQGPMVLELNARPGLSIQIANNDGLTTRCARVDAHISQRAGEAPRQRIAFAREALCNSVTE
ncbi:MAG: alpha-L-glutamate ligase-like protein [Alcanivoracaceae bacterium]|nr:alpha-L-glutamate ligase-like protein [Alcanivoracaceae bacterium]